MAVVRKPLSVLDIAQHRAGKSSKASIVPFNSAKWRAVTSARSTVTVPKLTLGGKAQAEEVLTNSISRTYGALTSQKK